jgi:hypothetical protein
MKKLLLLVVVLFNASELFAQKFSPPEYLILVTKADSLYKAKDYKQSAFTFSAAFKAFNGHGSPTHYYDVACCWALAGYPDSAFYNLKKSNYSNYDHVIADSDLVSLHNDKRWPAAIAIIKANQQKLQANYNWTLVRELDTIFHNDQDSRLLIEADEKKYGPSSKEVTERWKEIIKKDSINLAEVEAILDKYGWLSRDVIGNKGTTTLFLVIQHGGMRDRDKYLPMMREAVKKGNLFPGGLALVEDRSALEHGKKQIYGSQIAYDKKTGKYFVSPIEDEVNVDKRRAEVGLEPLETYVKNWDIDYKLPKE